MKEQISQQDVHAIKAKVEKMASFQLGAFGIPVGIVWLLLGVNELLENLERQLPIMHEKPYNIEISLAHLVFLIFIMSGGILTGYYQYRFYNRKFGAWFPSVLGTKTDRLIFAVGLPIILGAFLLQEASGSAFPLMALVFGILFSLDGVLGKPRKWYYPAVFLALMVVPFLPFLTGGGAETVRVVTYIAIGISLIFIGWLDHRNLMRLHRSLLEEKQIQ